MRECLKLNPDHKTCFPFYKRVKKLAKLREQLEKLNKGEKWMDCLAKGKEILQFEKSVDSIQLDVFRHTCKCNKEAGHIAEAIQECTEVLNNGDPNDLDILCERAEAHILNEQFDKGLFLHSSTTINSYHFSCRRLPKSCKRQWRIKKSKRRFEQGTKIVEAIAKEGLLQNLGR